MVAGRSPPEQRERARAGIERSEAKCDKLPDGNHFDISSPLITTPICTERTFVYRKRKIRTAEVARRRNRKTLIIRANLFTSRERDFQRLTISQCVPPSGPNKICNFISPNRPWKKLSYFRSRARRATNESKTQKQQMERERERPSLGWMRGDDEADSFSVACSYEWKI